MTTQATHTPGPWEIGSINKRDKNLWWSAVFTPKSTGKFHIPRACDALGVDREECEGNARLIASAPDLLDALRHARDNIADMFARMQFHPDHKDIEAPLLMTLENARKAIAKAEGRAE
jgi:hypothetical protein